MSGMGDAMATYYEAASCWKAEHAVTCAGGRPTATAEALGRLCRDLLFNHGRQAVKDLNTQPLEVTEAIERVTEANTLLSGLGFESGGLAAAHAVHNGLTAHHATKSKYHGEKVAFGTLVHLCLENNLQEAFRVAQFFYDVGLPITLEELGIQEDDVEGLRKVAERTCAKVSRVVWRHFLHSFFLLGRNDLQYAQRPSDPSRFGPSMHFKSQSFGKGSEEQLR